MSTQEHIRYGIYLIDRSELLVFQSDEPFPASKIDIKGCRPMDKNTTG